MEHPGYFGLWPPSGHGGSYGLVTGLCCLTEGLLCGECRPVRPGGLGKLAVHAATLIFWKKTSPSKVLLTPASII